MAAVSISRRFRTEAALTYMAVAVIALIYLQLLRRQPLSDSVVATAYGGYVLSSAVLGYLFAGWYSPPDGGWFEVVAVPVVISLLSPIGACLPLLAVDVPKLGGRSVLADAGGAMLTVVIFLRVVGPLLVIAGIGASIALWARAKATLCAA